MLCLEGVVVLDLSRRYPGGYTGMFLGDYGAEVIKIDPPGSTIPIKRKDLSEERYAAYLSLDRNKRSMVLDLKTEEGRDVFDRLARRADVIIEGFRPGVANRLGIGYQRLRELNPRLIYCSLSGFGQDGPYASIPAHDMNYIALGGALSLIGERDGQPYLPSNIVADMGGAGLHGTIGILLAIIARQKTGRGQFVDVSYLDGVISLLTLNASEYFESGVPPLRGEHPIAGGAPWAQVFRCKDGKYFTIGAGEEHLWANLCRALGREDLVPHHIPPREQSDKVIAEMREIFLTRTRDEWYEYLKDKQAGVAPVNDLSETFEDPQVIHRQMVVELEHPVFGKVRQTGLPVKLSETPGEIRTLGVPTGTDNEAILGELGYGAEQIERLRNSGALG